MRLRQRMAGQADRRPASLVYLSCSGNVMR
jgi:hypothetical protein